MFTVVSSESIRQLVNPTEEDCKTYDYKAKKDVVLSRSTVRIRAVGDILCSIVYGAQEAAVAVGVLYAGLRLFEAF